MRRVRAYGAEAFDERVRGLRSAAWEAGDNKMVAICDRALDCRDDEGTEEARRECKRVLDYADTEARS